MCCVMAMLIVLVFCLRINYIDANDKINVMALINLRQWINVAQLGTSKPSLSGRCPPIKDGTEPMPIPHKQPLNKRIRVCETKKPPKSPISRPPYQKKGHGKAPKDQNLDQTLSNQPNGTSDPMKSIKYQTGKFYQACRCIDSPRYTNLDLQFSEGSQFKALAYGKPAFL